MEFIVNLDIKYLTKSIINYIKRIIFIPLTSAAIDVTLEATVVWTEIVYVEFPLEGGRST